MKRSPMKRTTPLARGSKPLVRAKPLPKHRKPTRKAKEFAVASGAYCG